MLIVATAGHIDHGKTSLVRALTGVDTDQLPEERARGISIDLGFAYWQAGPGRLVAFVDVPGHQRFIRNMLAGVAAIHFALLVVAVDDGPMPQTVEHVQILDFLGVRHGVVVLAKADISAPGRVAEVERSVRDLLQGTSLQGVPALAVSARTGAGVPELQALLAQAAARHEHDGMRGPLEGRRPRFAVDRAFSVRGAGTVVTGTVYDGAIGCEDRLAVFPGGQSLRVRGIQVHGRNVPRTVAGERAAINVAGANLPALARGDWMVDPLLPPFGTLLLVRLALLADAAVLRHAGHARMYLGASERACRVLLQARRQLEPGATAWALLQVEQAVAAVNGDRFVLRDGPATRTLAGGLVLDPCPSSRRRWLGEAELTALVGGRPEDALRAMLAARGDAGVELARFERTFNLASGGSDAVFQACDTVILGKSPAILVHRPDSEALLSRVADTLRADDRPAVRLADLRQAAAPGLPLEAFESLLRIHAERLDISLAGGSVSLRTRRESVRTADHAAWERVRPQLEEAGLHPPAIDVLARSSGVPVGRLRAILYAQSRAGEVFALQPEKYLVRELVAQLAVSAANTSAQRTEGRFTAADYRDAIGTGRTLAIHVLEMLDTAGITRRMGDARTVVRDPRTVFGACAPFSLERHA